MFSFKNYNKQVDKSLKTDDKAITDRRIHDEKVREITREIARKHAKAAGEAALKGEI